MTHLRRYVVWLILMGLYGLVIAPLSHVIGHEDDHVHTADGGIIYKTNAPDVHGHGHHAGHGHADRDGHELAHHGHGDVGEHDAAPAHDHAHDTAEPEGPDKSPGSPSPLEHAADSLAHFSVSVSVSTPTIDVLPSTRADAPRDVEPTCFEAPTPRSVRLEQASPRGPPHLLA